MTAFLICTSWKSICVIPTHRSFFTQNHLKLYFISGLQRIKPVAISPKPLASRPKPIAPKHTKAAKPRIPKPVKQQKPRKSSTRKPRPKQAFWSRRNLILLGLEGLGLAIIALLGTMLAIGSSANTFSGSDFFAHLLPFATGVAVWVLICAGLLLIWGKGRRWLKDKWALLPASLAICLAGGMLWLAFHDGYNPAFTDFRRLVGGKQQAARTTLAHQVFAAYRRHDQAQLQKTIQRAGIFALDIQQAAAAFSVDVNLLYGIAATESSFIPRSSHDGGQGLFQITAVPKFILQQASQKLAVKQLDLANPRHNAFIAAATFKHYLAQMKQDLFLGLLAYNIGPRNGGLHFIMQQYGAKDFVTMQPYLQQLPRDYPIRVLAYALAFKMWQQHGKLLAYEQADNATLIQHMGIPGLIKDF